MRYIYYIVGLLLFSILLISCSPSTNELYKKAEAFEDQKQYKKAIEVYTRIMKRNPKFQDAVLKKGYCYLQDSSYAKALHYFQYLLKFKGIEETDEYVIETNLNFLESPEVIDHEVSAAEVFYHIGLAEYYLDSLRSSYKHLQNTIDRNYEISNCYVWQGLIWTKNGSLKRACDLFQKAKHLGDPDADRLINLYCKEKTEK